MGFTLAYLLLLLHAQFDVVDLFHVLEFLLQLNIRDTAMNDGFGFGIELQILLGFLAVDLHGFLDDLTFTQPAPLPAPTNAIPDCVPFQARPVPDKP